MPSIQWRQSARAQTLLLATTLLFILGLALLPATSSAHPGHSHGLSNFDGRIPGLSDFEHVGDTTYRYIPSREEYEIRHPGEPPRFLHGDPLPARGSSEKVVGGTILTNLPTNELSPICRTAGHRIAIVFRHQTFDGASTPTATLRSIVRRMNWKIADQSSKSSGGSRVVRMAVDCDSQGNINVYDVETSSGDFDWIREAVNSAIPRPTHKLVFNSAGSSQYAGLGGIVNSNTKSRANGNAGGGNVALIYNRHWENHVPVHELLHTLGAAQGSVSPAAPYSTPGYHCVDGIEVLCYEDASGSAWGQYTETRCPPSGGWDTPTTLAIDCGNDTYFDAAPTSGTYLANYWNVAGVENPFLAAVPSQSAGATTEAATSIGKTSGVLNGRVAPNGDYVFYQFQYGTDTSYGSQAPAEMTYAVDEGGTADFGSLPNPVSQSISGLRSNGTTYHYRVVAKNDNGQLVYGQDRTFRTLGPIAVTGDATDLVPKTATLHATINPNGVSTQCKFRWNIDGEVLRIVNGPDMGSGVDDVECTLQLRDLQPYITYRYVAEAVSTNRTSMLGQQKTFTTPGWGYAKGTVQETTDTTRHETTLHGTVNPMGTTTSYHFEYADNEAFVGALSTETKSAGSGTEDVPVRETIEGLEENTRYYVRLAVTNPVGTAYSKGSFQDSFATLAWWLAATTGAASGVTSTSATLHAAVDANFHRVSYEWEWGTTPDYGRALGGGDIGWGNFDYPGSETPTEVSDRLEGLEPNTTYHYRVQAVDWDAGVLAVSEDMTFTTTPWTTQTTPNPTPWDESSLEDTSCTSSTMCMAVGNDDYAKTGIVQLWDGTGWSIFKTLDNTRFSSISCASATYCVATGVLRNTGAATALEVKPDDIVKTRYLVPPTPPGGTQVTLTDVSCSSSTACTAVGHYYDASVPTYKPLALRWDASQWTIQTTPYPSGGDGSDGKLLGVSCPSATSCTAVGTKSLNGTQAFAERWDGTAWSIVSVPNPAGATESDLEDVSCVSGSACMAVGWFKESGSQKGLAESWNGTQWTPIATPGQSDAVFLNGVSCASASACVAVGLVSRGFGGIQGETTLAEVWDGRAWTSQLTPSPQRFSRLSSVSCVSSDACTAVGKARPSSASRGTVTLGASWDGGAWATQTTPNPTPWDESSLEDTSCASSTMCMAVGNDDYAKTGIVQLWDGTGWSIFKTLDNTRFSSISCASATYCVATGVLRNTGAATALEVKPDDIVKTRYLVPPTPPGGTQVTLTDVSCSSSTACTAVGHYYDASVPTYKPLALRWDASQWTIQTTPYPNGGDGSEGKLLGVSCPSATSCTAVGTKSLNGTQAFAERWDGTAWSIVSVPNPAGATESDLEDVSCVSGSACMAVGWFKESGSQKGLAESWNGTQWTPVSTPGQSDAVFLNGVSCATASACVAVGLVSRGFGGLQGETTLAEVWDGRAWAFQLTPSPQRFSRLSSVSCVSSDTCTAVGKARPGSAGRGTVTLGESYND